MKIADSWLKQYITTDLSTDKIAEYLTDIGLEVEGVTAVESINGSLEGVVIGKVLTCDKHPNADKLNVTKVLLKNDEVVQIVCGAPNIAAGQIVPVATIGTKIYSNAGEFFLIKEAKIRGEQSQGMICSEDELGLSGKNEGIMVLDGQKFSVGEALSNYFSVEKDSVYEIGLTPNRTDAMSHYGVARDLNAYLSCNDFESNLQPLAEVELHYSDVNNFNIKIDDAELCPRYLGAVVDGISVKDSPEWLKNKLKAIGLSPVNNIVDISNYILHSYGQPLHTFDASQIAGNTINVGQNDPGTKFTTLDGVERTLNGSEIMIKDGNNTPLCIAGVFGGQTSGVALDTTKIFIESAYFSPVSVRRSAKYHGLNTDASFRFERGVDPNLSKFALQKAVELILEIAGGKMMGEITDFYPNPVQNKIVKFRYQKLAQILGAKIPDGIVKEILNQLEIKILNEKTEELSLEIPAYRADVTREIDVIEEILRIYGFNKIKSPEKIAFTPVKVNLKDQDELENTFAQTLQSVGFNEVMNNSLTSLKDDTNGVKILNPLSNELSFMRKSLLEGLLENASFNIKRKSANIKFFELGKVYHKRDRYEERKQMALLVTGRNIAENWLMPHSTADFYDLKSYLYLLLNRTNLNLNERVMEDNRFSEGIELYSGDITIARLGRVSAALLLDADVEQECFYAEIELEKVQHLRKDENFVFASVPKFNKIRRDLALLVDQSSNFEEMKKSAKNSSPLIKEVNLFDVYDGKNIPEGKKSYALSFDLLNENKTLEEKDISEVMNRLIKMFQKDFGAVLR